MKEQLISFETAKLAKEKGFDYKKVEASWSAYNLDGKRMLHTLENESRWYFAPTQFLLQKWLREKYEIHVLVDVDGRDRWEFYVILFGSKWSPDDRVAEITYKTCEEALEEGLKEALKLINP